MAELAAGEEMDMLRLAHNHQKRQQKMSTSVDFCPQKINMRELR